MTNNLNQLTRRFLLVGLLAGASLSLWNCSGSNKESSAETMTTDTASGSDSSVFGRQGDTLNSSNPGVSQQAPPDSASAGGAVVPAEVKVKVKQ
ncbi:hypothetical protein GGR92_002556 [Spirosoma lacussanchae]|uniref:hypothetical protein n=1 Tax=Spirosoma lacussanchae TaxID=1884249 RepID=UPI001108A04F|nr:hypothetical protein [Spirosoma lacussanchae]